MDIRQYTYWIAISRDDACFIFSAPDSSDKYMVLYKQGLGDASGTTRVELTTVPPEALAYANATGRSPVRAHGS